MFFGCIINLVNLTTRKDSCGSGVDVSTGIQTTELYYNGSIEDIDIETFQGPASEISLAATYGLDFGIGVSYSPPENGGLINNAVFGYSRVIGVGVPILEVPVSGNINTGWTEEQSDFDRGARNYQEKLEKWLKEKLQK